MPSTPRYGFPYPDPTAPVAQGADDIRALAERSEYVLSAAPWRTYVPQWVSAGSPGTDTYLGRFTTLGAAMLLAISWKLGAGINLPTHVVLGLPPGVAQTPETQSLHVGFYVGSGAEFYPGVASVVANKISLYSNNGAPLGAGQLQLGGSVHVQGVVSFTTPPTE